MNIELHGLTQKQVALCDIMWAIESKEGVDSFIATLPKADQRDCQTLIEMIQLAFTDEIDSVDEASILLENFRSM